MKLSIIILSYNTKDLLKQTIDSIPRVKNWEIIVVDNGSKDGSPEMVEQSYPRIQVIRSSKNLGFAAGNNLGIKVAQGEYLLLLNSDTQVLADAIERSLAYLDRHPQVGALTPKILLPDGAIDLACHRGLPTPWNSFTYFAKLESVFPNSKVFAGYHQTYQDFENTHEIEATACTAMFVRMKTVEEVGSLDERFFFYAEDLDWSKRITDAGWQIVYFPEAKILHYKSQSGKNNQKDLKAANTSVSYFYDTMKQFYEKHYENTYPKWVQKLVFKVIDIKKNQHLRKK